jgi:CheY-like chemotaxis protein
MLPLVLLNAAARISCSPVMNDISAEGSKRTVLVVDDSPSMQRYLQTILEFAAYRVETAGDGEEALQRIREGREPDVVLLDLEMPGMGGLATLQHLVRLRPDLPVIICSGIDDPSVMESASSLGAHAYLMKPVQQLYLTAALERCLHGSPDSLGTS